MTDREYYHTVFGTHSNIPECCIKFFINRDKLSDDDFKRRVHKINKVLMVLDISVGYVPCPTCVNLRRFNKLHKCDAFNPSCRQVKELIGGTYNLNRRNN